MMITPEILLAYEQCRLKAYQLLCTDKIGTLNEFTTITQDQINRTRRLYFTSLKIATADQMSYSSEGIKKGAPFLVEATLEFEDLVAYTDALTKNPASSPTEGQNYSPILVVGAHNVNRQHELHLAFIAFVLSKLQNEKPKFGTIVGSDNRERKIAPNRYMHKIESILKELRIWKGASDTEPPPLILNKHCAYCQFQEECKWQAEKFDHLS